jgi:hypothetical protein
MVKKAGSIYLWPNFKYLIHYNDAMETASKQPTVSLTGVKEGVGVVSAGEREGMGGGKRKRRQTIHMPSLPLTPPNATLLMKGWDGETKASDLTYCFLIGNETATISLSHEASWSILCCWPSRPSHGAARENHMTCLTGFPVTLVHLLRTCLNMGFNIQTSYTQSEKRKVISRTLHMYVCIYLYFTFRLHMYHTAKQTELITK